MEIESCRTCDHRKMWKGKVNSEGNLQRVVKPPVCKDCIRIVHQNYVRRKPEKDMSDEDWEEVPE